MRGHGGRVSGELVYTAQRLNTLRGADALACLRVAPAGRSKAFTRTFGRFAFGPFALRRVGAVSVFGFVAEPELSAVVSVARLGGGVGGGHGRIEPRLRCVSVVLDTRGSA